MSLALKKGDRVALMMPNILQYPICLFGILQAGMVAVNVNPLYTGRELEHQLNDSGANTIVLFANSAHILEKVIERTCVQHTIITEIGDFLSFPKSLMINFILKRVKKVVPPYKINNALDLKQVVAGSYQRFKRPSINHEDIAFLQYTGRNHWCI